MVGVPRFELGSKRPKRPSIGQTNPYALGLCHGVSPMNFTQRTSTVRWPNGGQDLRVLLAPLGHQQVFQRFFS